MQNQQFDVSFLPPFDGFEQAAEHILSFLHERLGFGLWMVTRTEEDDWIILKSEDNGYRVKAGDVFCWSDSFCSRMVQGLGPHVAPRSAEVMAYRQAPIGSQVPISAYIGVPLTNDRGELFGTLCAIDPNPKDKSLESELFLIQSLARILSTILMMEIRGLESARQLEHVQAEAERDPLTGLYNRRGWKKFIETEEKRCQRYGSPAGVIMLDLDGLKRVNDLEGHSAGDRLLQGTARLLKRIVRPYDVIARLGGDELAVLLIESSFEHMLKAAERIRSEFDATGIDLSIGFAARDPRKSLSEAIEEADQNMYQNKLKRKETKGANAVVKMNVETETIREAKFSDTSE